jgi:putative FmdB family regulatory protein
MPRYDYRCRACGYTWEATHSASERPAECPSCEGQDFERLITSAPTVAGGILTHAGDGYRATQEQLRSKWAEETPKLRKKLRDKLGDRVDQLPTLNHNYDE